MGVIRIKDKYGKITEIPSFKGDPGEISLAYGHKNFANAIENSVSGNSVVLNDSSAAPLRALKIYGKSTQNGTPAPDAPIDIVSVGDDGSVGTWVCGKNLINAKLNTPISANDEYNLYYLGENKTYTIRLKQKCLALGNKGAQHWIAFFDKNGNRINGSGFCTFLFSSVDEVKEKTYTFTTPANTHFVRIDLGAYYGANQEIKLSTIECQLELNQSATEYENYKAVQNLVLSTPLRAIPVTDKTLATYTDANGQMWCADEIDLEKGVYIQRIIPINAGEQYWTVNATWSGQNSDCCIAYFKHSNMKYDSFLCTHFTKYFSASGAGWTVGKMGMQENGVIYAAISKSAASNGEEFRQYMANLGTVIYGIAITPIVTALTAKQIAEYQALRTNYPNTTILNDENAFMDVAYVADTKMYIDNKIAALRKGGVTNVR